MYRALVIDEDAANRLSFSSRPSNWLEKFEWSDDQIGVEKIVENDIVYLIGPARNAKSRLLVVGARRGVFFPELPEHARAECFRRILIAALSRFQPTVKLPPDWRVYHSGSLVSFQTNRFSTQIAARIYLDFAPENTEHAYAFAIVNDKKANLSRSGFNAEIFETAVLGYDDAIAKLSRGHGRVVNGQSGPGHFSVALTQAFPDSDVTLGRPFSEWRDRLLNSNQLAFFNAPFSGPLRVRGPAGTGKTLVLTMRFLKEAYQAIDKGQPIRAAFLTHGNETAEHIRTYLLLMDERNLLLSPSANIDLQITTVHGIANDFINYDTEGVQPLSLDGSEGRQLQFELIQSLVSDYCETELSQPLASELRPEFRAGLDAPKDDARNQAFCCDLIDEFANVLETFGVRDIDEIGEKYRGISASPRGLGQTGPDRVVVMALYRRFRNALIEMGVVSLDQFVADFLAYLNSFRWDSVRPRKGFDFVFADELHLFNRQERRVLGYLLRDSGTSKRVAVAYDPRQSPRNSFFPESRTERDAIWREAKLDDRAQQFELSDVFRYTPQILAFLDTLNQHFPAEDLAEEWEMHFGVSKTPEGPKPTYLECETRNILGATVAKRAVELMRRQKAGERVAVLCLDYERFATYRSASVFQDNFIAIGARDDTAEIQRFNRRVVLSMPEYVAGLQFDAVVLVDVNANLIATQGGGVNGLQRFISAVYLGASRAKKLLEIYSDRSAGGLAQPIRNAIEAGTVDLMVTKTK